MSSYLTNLIIPYNLCLTLVVVGLVLGLFRLRKTGGALILAGLLWALAWSLPVTSLWLGGALENRYPHLPPAESPTADAIVVLGGNTANGRANWFLPYDKDTAVVRVDTAAQLYLAGRAPKVVLSGGALEGDVSEARGMAHAIRQQGVPESALILENASRTTYENAALTEDQLKTRGIGKVLLVTSALHMPRAMAAFSKQGVIAIAAPAPPQIVAPADGSLNPWLPDHARSTPAAPSSRNTPACSSTGCAGGSEDAGLAGVPARVRRLLHRAVDHAADPRHARRQAGRRALYPAAAGHALRPLRPARASGILRRAAGPARNVRIRARICDPLAGGTGTGHGADTLKAKTGPYGPVFCLRPRLICARPAPRGTGLRSATPRSPSSGRARSPGRARTAPRAVRVRRPGAAGPAPAARHRADPAG